MRKRSNKPESGRKAETLRRRRLGDLQRLYRHRYRGTLLTDDDAGHEDLRELLLVASLAYNSERMMRNTIRNWAPWMDEKEAAQMIDDVNRTPPYLRKPSARILGDRLRLTDQERTVLGIVTIRPFDMTDEQLVERRKAKDNARKWWKSREAGKKPRDAWLANRWSRLRPWEKQKPPISRATWYRRRADQVRQVRETDMSAVKFNRSGRTCLSGESEKREIEKECCR
jgi:hypothetical protein